MISLMLLEKPKALNAGGWVWIPVNELVGKIHFPGKPGGFQFSPSVLKALGSL